MDNKYKKAIGIIVRNSIKKRIRQNEVKPASQKEKGATLIKSGLLVNSIKYQIEGGKIIIGTNKIYARIHHEGGTINKSVTVREHERNIKQAFGKKLKKIIQAKVREHTRKMNLSLPARPYMFIDDPTKNRIAEVLKKAVLDNFKK